MLSGPGFVLGGGDSITVDCKKSHSSLMKETSLPRGRKNRVKLKTSRSGVRSDKWRLCCDHGGRKYALQNRGKTQNKNR